MSASPGVAARAETIFVHPGHPLAKAYFGIRRAVFVREQNVAESIEIDEFDAGFSNNALALHAITVFDGEPACAGRLILTGRNGIAAARIGRIAVLPEFRKRGLGTAMVKFLLAEAVARGASEVTLHSQCYITGMYSKLGFEVSGEPFDEAGIPHIEMRYTGGRA